MYFKASGRTNPTTNQHESYYRLAESYRNSNGRVCHRTILNIGFLPEAMTPEQLNQISRYLTNTYQRKQELFDLSDPLVKRWAFELWNRIVSEERLDLSLYDKDSSMIDTDTMVHKNVREIGSEWMCHTTWQKLDFDKVLRNNGFSEQEIKLAQTQIISRAVYPKSELATAKWIKENSAICELTGFPEDKINKDRLYRGALKLYKIKEELEQHLSTKTNELFDIQDKIYLYDLTNTYFEGEKRNSKLAQFGRSKEKRTDAKLVVLALVVNTFGFIKYSSIHEGNFADSKGLKKVIEGLDYTTKIDQPIVVIDAGIASEDNLKMIKSKGYDYLCVSRKKLTDNQIAKRGLSLAMQTKSDYSIALSSLEVIDQTDSYVEVISHKKALKEQGMKDRFETRFEEELIKIQQALGKKGGTKRIDKVHQRIGRARQKYPSVHHRYDIHTTNDIQAKHVVDLQWIKNNDKDQQKNANLGKYHLRTSLKLEDEKTIWEIYNTIREVESTFRCLKTDLDLRPIYHKNDDSTMAHLHLGLLSYWIVNTIRCILKSKDIKHSWKELVRIGNTQKTISTLGQNKAASIIKVRKCSVPSKKLKKLYIALEIKQKPYKQQKSVVHKPPPKKMELANKTTIRSG